MTFTCGSWPPVAWLGEVVERAPVTGSVDGETVTVGGESTRVSNDLSLTERVRVRATQDRLGRLNGIVIIEHTARLRGSLVSARTIELEMQPVARYH